MSAKVVTDLVFPRAWLGLPAREPTSAAGWTTVIQTAMANDARWIAAEGIKALLRAETDTGPDYDARILGARLCDHYGLRAYLGDPP